MKYTLVFIIFIPLWGLSQTKKTEAQLRALKTFDTAIVYRVVTGNTSALYQWIPGATGGIQLKGGAFLKLVPEISQKSPNLLAEERLIKIVDSIMSADVFYIDGKYFEGGTKEFPLKPKNP